VNAEQASKAVMWKPTRRDIGEGGYCKGRERRVHFAIPPGYWRQHAHKRKIDATREAPLRGQGIDQPAAGAGRAGRDGVAERPVVLRRLGNASGGNRAFSLYQPVVINRPGQIVVLA